MSNAHIILWVTPANEELLKEEIEEIERNKGKYMLGIINKCDIGNKKEKKKYFDSKEIENISVSLIKNKSIDSIYSAIIKLVEKIASTYELPSMLFNKRHEQIGKNVLIELIKGKKEIERQEILAHHLKTARNKMNEIFGATDNEELLNSIFDKFCIGK